MSIDIPEKPSKYWDALERTASPFDAIRQIGEGGIEWWSARDLMPLLGYNTWENFASALDRAMAAASVQGHRVDDLFRGFTKKGAGRPQQDFGLARFACYLVAMNGDPRKAEVAAAQSYFAIKTREAEVGKPMPTHSEALRGWAAELERAEQAEARAAQMEPSATAWDRLHELGADYEVADAAKILSRDSDIEIGRNRLFEFMHDHDWIFRGRHNCWKAYQDQVDLGRLKHRPGVEYWDKEREQYRTGDPTILITPKGLAELRRLLGRQSGQLELVVS